MELDEIRKEFETVISSTIPGIPFDKDIKGRYQHRVVTRIWLTWQTAREFYLNRTAGG
jgi:hypothetical protein